MIADFYSADFYSADFYSADFYSADFYSADFYSADFYSALAVIVLVTHIVFILWVIFGAVFTRRRPILRFLHIASLLWGVLAEILPWSCPLTIAENLLEARAGVQPYRGGFLLHYLDALVYPNISPTALTVAAVIVCLANLGIYARRFWLAHPRF